MTDDRVLIEEVTERNLGRKPPKAPWWVRVLEWFGLR